MSLSIRGLMNASAIVPSVLVADDQADVRTSLQLALKCAGFEAQMADSPEAVLAAVALRQYDVLLMDLNYTRDTTSGGEGLDLLPRLKALDRDLPVVAMTAWATIDLAIEAMRRGARDFVLKPWDNATLVKTVRAQAQTRRDSNDRNATRALEARDQDGARRVQSRLLPQNLPRLATLECAARCSEAGPVGGDGYDFIDLGSGRLAVVLADVSGKGIPGAILWAHLQATLRSRTDLLGGDLTALMQTVNGLFFAATAPEHFATMFLGVYDDGTLQLRYVNCGHNPPLLARENGDCEQLSSTAPALGLMERWTAHMGEVVLRPSDTLLIYSDGVTEARPSSASGVDDEFGEARLAAFVQRHRRLSLADLPSLLLSAVQAFAGGAPQDDRTIVALRGLSPA
ncbi:MAG: SpoIIE family protein phosphatase [Vicinamibacteria bacterium]|nr:SpoIIE family protein phosphatase [Vicinamibacteria bacterium]